MEKSKKDFKKWIILILVALIGYWIVNNSTTIGNVFSNLFSVIFPFILGGCLAFILNIPMTFFERKLSKVKNKSKSKNKNKKEKKSKGLRILSLILSILVILLVLALIINLIVPELINIGKMLIDNIPYYLDEITKFIEKNDQNITELNTFIQEQNIDVEAMKNQIISKIGEILNSSISIISGIVSGIVSFFIAIIFAIYILMDKEKLQEQAKKLLYAYLSKERADKIMNIGKVSNNTFKSFFTVQCLEATILGTLCILGMLILRIPYAIPIGVLVGVTALIPVIGAFIGCIVGAILIVVVNPIKAITFVIFFLILQQVEGNLIYPRVVGSSVGLPGMWVLVAVTVGGKLGGILGMLIGVPIVSIIYILLRKDVNEKLENKEGHMIYENK
ncbi:MAG: AI-2E family transporter [Clostridia bacterium]